MNSLLRLGYLLIGFGVGILSSAFVLDHELSKPIGEIEEYIPREDRDDTETDTESDSLYCESDRNDQDNSEKDISQRRRSRNRSSGSSKGRDHAEFGTGKANLYNFYTSNEACIRDPNRSQRNSDDRDSNQESTPKGTGKSKMEEADERRREFEKRRAENNKNLKTRYSKMYDNSGDESETGGDSMNDILHRVNARTNTRESYVQENEDGDEEYYESEAVEIDIHDEYNLEQIEGPFEVFLGDCPMCESIPLTYYAGDYTLCDDGDQVIPDPEDVVGMAALNRLLENGPGVHDGVVMFVHNALTKINYEIMLEEGTYKDSVAGQIDEKFSKRSSL